MDPIQYLIDRKALLGAAILEAITKGIKNERLEGGYAELDYALNQLTTKLVLDVQPEDAPIASENAA